MLKTYKSAHKYLLSFYKCKYLRRPEYYILINNCLVKNLSNMY